ncbi:hypothetical protein BGX38DRAFT_1265891 [Terfezia claveryi]|nr:hypothetical protein BGX38DRAFT_1265891 [Terfezia claveryi]
MSQEWGSMSQRRKSFGFFSRPTILQELSDSGTNTVPKSLQKSVSSDLKVPRSRPKSLLFGAGGFTHELSTTLTIPSPRTKVLTKAPRPKSMFGSFKAKEVGFVTESSGSSSATSSRESHERDSAEVTDVSAVVLHHGEALSTGGLLRRKKEYLVLTTRELLRYKSQQKAWEQLGMCSINPKTPTTGRTASFSSASDLTMSDNVITLLQQIVAVYMPEMDTNSTTIQVDHVDEVVGPGSTMFQLPTIGDAHIWLDNLRRAAAAARDLLDIPPISNNTIAHIARRLEAEKDYAPDQFFRVYTVVQRGSNGKHHRPSSDDLHKMYSTVCYLAIGVHKVHIVPIPKTSTNRSAASLLLTGPTTSFGTLTLTTMSMSTMDDSFTLGFRRLPCRPEIRLTLASCDVANIIQSIRQISEYLRPEWVIPPYSMDIPEYLKDEPLALESSVLKDEYNNIDRTIAAYCAAYDLDASSVCYGISTDVEDGPQFILYPPLRERRKTYSDLELLAVLRSLRWNEAFGSISFRGISLDPLMKAFDTYGDEYEPYATRQGRPIKVKSTDSKRPLLVWELRALALCSTKLRRMGFRDSITRRKKGDFQNSGEEGDGCGIVEAIMPLCRRGYTNVDWFDLTGIELVESDLDWLVDAAASRLAHFRGFELGRCGLTERMVSLFLAALVAHENTLEALDLSGNPARLHAPSLNTSMCYFPYLRKLNLSRVLRTSGLDPLLTAEVLLRWRLQELDLSETQLNSETVDAVSTYLASSQSDALHQLFLTQTGITSRDVAIFMHSMCRTPGKARDLHLHIGQNYLHVNHGELVEAIALGLTPSHLTMRMVDYPKEDMFRELIRALTINTTIQFLDLSKVSLPYEAGSETCAELGELFAKNTTLVELDLSGEQAVLESARLGSGIIAALGRLAENSTLQSLRIELQTLGTSGALVLSQMLRKNNTLRHLHCDMNRIYLQGFSAMVNALEHNTTMLYLPRMEWDRAEQVKAVKEQFNANSSTNSVANIPPPQPIKSTFLYRKSADQLGGKKDRRVSISEQPFRAHVVKSMLKPSMGRQLSTLGEEQGVPPTNDAGSSPYDLLRTLDEKWDAEIMRLDDFLRRNVNLITGLAVSQVEEELHFKNDSHTYNPVMITV